MIEHNYNLGNIGGDIETRAWTSQLFTLFPEAVCDDIGSLDYHAYPARPKRLTLKQPFYILHQCDRAHV